MSTRSQVPTSTGNTPVDTLPTVVSAPAGAAATETHPAPETDATAVRSTVEQVVKATEAELHSPAPANLRMDFDFGDARVTVRVELREGAVQAHFHTDSPALQSSLDREWHAAAAAQPERFSHFAEPSFDGGAFSAGGQPPAGDRRDSRRRAGRDDQAPSFFPSLGRATTVVRTPSAAPALRALLPLSQLNTFA